MEERPSLTADQTYDVAVIGGGASGLAAAIAASREGARTCIIERDVAAGLTILATGNGRCNLSNAHLDPASYRHPETFREIVGGTPEAELQGFFESLGLMVAEEGDGRLYPRTRRAESVRDVLLQTCGREGVDLRCCTSLTDARRDTDGAIWELFVAEPEEPLRCKRGRDERTTLRNARRALRVTRLVERPLCARAVIIACGGTCKEVAELFGLPHLPEEPVLCPVACAAHDLDLAKLDGLRVEAGLSLMRGDATIAHEEGEVLFRPYGISGIAAFNLSRCSKSGDVIELDLFPELTEAELAENFRSREEFVGPLAATGPSWFDGILAPALGKQISATISANHEDALTAALRCKHLNLAVTGLAETDRAQLRRGGIPLDALDLSTLAVRPSIAPALHVCGKALDMDADCGGYNLAWAWLSGLRAGSAAARIHTTEKDHA